MIGDNTVLSLDKRLENIESAYRRGLKKFEFQPLNGGRWNICAGGPSLRDEISKLRKAKGRIVSMNGSYDYLFGKGVKSDYFILADPIAFMGSFLSKPRKDVIYLIAAHCDPGVFDALAGFDVRVWDMLQYDSTDRVKADGSNIPIGGGSTVGLRAINLGHALGFRDIHLWGFDGCLKGSKMHSYSQDGDGEVGEVSFTCYGKVFNMTLQLINQAEDFKELLRRNPGLKLTVHTHGIIRHIYKHTARSSSG